MKIKKVTEGQEMPRAEEYCVPTSLRARAKNCKRKSLVPSTAAGKEHSRGRATEGHGRKGWAGYKPQFELSRAPMKPPLISPLLCFDLEGPITIKLLYTPRSGLLHIYCLFVLAGIAGSWELRCSYYCWFF